ncbi:MAG: hypothetical protein A3E07_03895 [Candidatus Wildermuthbacteria bacterium RIFCSPHIGHO2_12_FULL_45_9]|nr:MAG: hypothetical protein A3E07_03895 [Candidatus Wildermuthbacteria bacterium RIFCSPHIGHO2_12_FULL_45_9]
MKFLGIFFVGVFLLAVLLAPSLSFGAACDACDADGICAEGFICRGGDPTTGDVLEGVCQPKDGAAFCPVIPETSLIGLINKIIDFIFWVATILFPFLVVFAAFQFIIAAGDPAKIKKGRDMLLWASIGYGVILISKGLIFVFRDIIGIKGG